MTRTVGYRDGVVAAVGIVILAVEASGPARPSIMLIGAAMIGWPVVTTHDQTPPRHATAVTRWVDRRGRWQARITWDTTTTTQRRFRTPQRREDWCDRQTRTPGTTRRNAPPSAVAYTLTPHPTQDPR